MGCESFLFLMIICEFKSSTHYESVKYRFEKGKEILAIITKKKGEEENSR